MNGIKLAPLLTKIEVDIESFKKDMEKAAVVGKTEAEKISKDLSQVTKVGEQLSQTGARLTAGLTVPLLGAATATGKMAVDFESNFAKVSTLLDDSIVDFDKYKEELLNASSDSKVAVGEFSEAVYSSISAGVDQTKAIGFTTDAMKLAKGGFTDGAKAVDVLTTAINGYNLKAEDASRISDLLITTQNLGKTTVDELASSMGTVIPVANSVNFGIEELSASYAQLTKNGIATAESGTYLKSMLSELGKSGSITDKTLRELTGKGFAQLKSEGKATSEILQMLSEAAEKDDKTLKDMFGSVEAGSAALVLAKGNGAEYNEMLAGMEKSAGATQEAFEKMDATPAEKMAGAMNKLKNAGIEFGFAFVPVVEKAADTISSLADKFSDLSDEQGENILKWGTLLVAAGPVLSIAGKGVTTFTSLASVVGGLNGAIGETGAGAGLIGGLTGIAGAALPVAGILAGVGAGAYAVHESLEFLNGTVLDTEESMGLIEKAWAKLTGVTVYTKQELQELGYVHKDFAENISEEFQDAVKESTKTLQDFDIFLREINFDGVLDENESSEFDSKVNDICQSAIDTINSRKEEATQGINEMFLLDDGVISESEQSVLDYLGKTYDTSTSRISEIMDEIYRIREEAYANYGKLRDEDIADIKAYLEEVKQLELESIGSTNEEILYAKNEFNARVENMDLESASQLLQEKSALRDEEIVKIKASYDTKLELLRMDAETATGEEKANLEEQIKIHQKARDEKIQAQMDLYDSYLSIIREKNPQMLEEINEYNGELLSNQDRTSKQYLEVEKAKFEALGQVTESGCYRMYNSVDKVNQDVVVNVDNTTGKIIGIYNKTKGTTAGVSESVAMDTAQMASSYEDSVRIINDAQIAYVDEAGNVYDVTGENIGQVNDFTDVVYDATGAITALNGTPVKIISNAPAVKGEMDVLKGSMDSIERNIDIYINTHYNTSGSPAAHSPFNQSACNGLDYVPYDGYTVKLHKGERVLTEAENRGYSTGSGSSIDYDKLAKALKNAVSGMGVYYDEREIGRVYDGLSGRG